MFLICFVLRAQKGLGFSEESNSKEVLLQVAYEYIQKHDTFTVPELARACAISESGVYSLFRDYAHTTPIDVKHQIITERAVALLTTTDLAVETISSTLGLCSSAHLRKILKKQLGKTPMQIRNDAKFI
ncbi:MAG: helix-turn-helix transcriptional regulator [Clostridia bacterium]|nr:helix-turn-helix transcriptional regulator [Clostridia bacterium]